DNVLHYTAIVKKSSVAQSISEGAFSAVANFNLIYQ
ncbi:TPA: F7-2 fimbrial protein, partial [Escherichia coli]|nr:F7-2 fimbrial protein [Escherichia coli]